MKQTLAALNDTILRISRQNTDSALTPLIAEAMTCCRRLDQLLESMAPIEKAAFSAAVDVKVFQRLMAIAGPTTALELLNQILLDVGAAQNAIRAAAPKRDWPAMRKECHVLIAVAGSIGAFDVMRSAETLHRAIQRSDETAATSEAGFLIHLLDVLLAYVQDQRDAMSKT